MVPQRTILIDLAYVEIINQLKLSVEEFRKFCQYDSIWTKCLRMQTDANIDE